MLYLFLHSNPVMLESLMLLRHAEAESNHSKFFAGWSDVPLTDLGREQAELLSRRLGHERFDRIFCSDLTRAKETLRLSGISAPTTYTPQLREKNYGTLEGVNWQSHPEYYADHLNPFKVAPEGESAELVQKRVVDYFEKTILTSGARSVLIVSHHGPLMLLSCHLLSIALKDWRVLRMGNAGLSKFDFEEGRFRMTLWNSVSHLGMPTNKGLFG
jgi:broad specificity phosphatase PhoE